jgi:F-type H+-transporting ATPase subunit delta
MAHAGPLAAVYAQALAEVVEAEGGTALLQEAAARITALGKAWEENRTLRAYLHSARVPAVVKRATFERLFADWPRTIANFVRLVYRRDRLDMLPEIGEAVARVVDERLGRIPVTLATARAMSPQQIGQWSDVLRSALGKEPVIRHVVRPELVAGAVVRAGGVVADGSARRRLTELKQRIIRRGKHALQP